MKRRLILCLVAALALAAPASATGLADAIVAQLRAQGFSEVSVGRTLLGRTRILAEGDAGVREIILNPNTGEILRDLYTAAEGGPALAGPILTEGQSGSSSGKGSGDDDADDSNDDRSDNSGSGSDDSGGDDSGGDDGGGGGDGGNSGSGGGDGGNSGKGSGDD